MQYIVGIFIIIFLNACSVKYELDTVAQNSNKDKYIIIELQNKIEKLSDKIDKNEAKNVASIAILYSKYLANEYKLVKPPLYHNTLVQMGIKKRGFCFHFAQDLIKKLKKQNLKTVDLHWVVHEKAQYWEHSSIVVSAKDKSIQDGIILDAWRNSGILYWNNIKNDSKYNWVEDIIRSKYYGTLEK